MKHSFQFSFNFFSTEAFKKKTSLLFLYFLFLASSLATLREKEPNEGTEVGVGKVLLQTTVIPLYYPPHQLLFAGKNRNNYQDKAGILQKWVTTMYFQVFLHDGIYFFILVSCGVLGHFKIFIFTYKENFILNREHMGLQGHLFSPAKMYITSYISLDAPQVYK